MDYQAALAATKRGDFAGAEAILSALLAGAPDDLRYLYELGVALAAQGRFSEARPLYERCHAERPGHARVALSLGILRLATGDFAGGWPLYDLRLGFADFGAVVPPFPRWEGQDLVGKTLLVGHEQGFGDMIMCARFAAPLKAMGARVLWVAPPPLTRLFQALGVEVLTYDGRALAPPTRPDFHTHPFSIPRWLGVTPETIPPSPYLAGVGSARPGGVGVVWRGRPSHPRDRLRSLPEDLGRALLARPGAVSLDPADTGARDFQDTADLIAGLDRVVTVDTATAHLAGAIGKPVTILLPRHGLDWRWGEEGATSPWYPSARLLRQPAPGDWASVVELV
jgi:hypothetical protein